MKKIITYGTYDLLTPGHIEQLRESKKLGDYLIVGLSTDEFNTIKNKKSYLNYEERKEILESIKYVDEVIPEENWEQKVEDIKKYDISILTMGEDWKGSDRFDYLKEYCEVIFIPRSGRWSSTNFRSFVSKHKNDNNTKAKIKTFFKKVGLGLFKWHLRFIYFFIKLFTKQKREVFLLSRQTNTPSISFQKIIKELKDKKIGVKVVTGRINKGLINYLSYYFSLYRQMCYIATSKVVIIDGYNPTVSILKHKKGTTVIQLWHALAAIKKFGYQSLGLDSGRDVQTSKVLDMHKNYDYMISGSDAMKPYFSEAFNMPEDNILSYGSPVIDYMLETLNKKDIYKKYPHLMKKPIILYAPTFRENRKNDILSVISKVDLQKYNLIVSIHPAALDEEIEKEGVLYNPEIEFLDLIKLCDYFITDYSAAMLEAAIAKKKLLLYVYDYHLYDKENGLNIDLFEEFPYTSKEIDDLIKIIEEDNYDMKKLQKFVKKYVTNLDNDNTRKLCEFVKEKLS